MIYKLVDGASFFHDDEPVARVVVPGKFDESGLTKSASHSEIEAYINNVMEPKPGKMYLHINAMGAGEYFGANKNGDYFPEEQLIRYHKTFEEFGYVYRHHINKDPAKSMGKVVFAIYNHEMHRVELIAEVDTVLGGDILDRIEAGDFPFTSMACKTPFDVCSICNNKAHTRNEYCEHLSRDLNKVYPDGRKVMALNLGPLKFFDISIVIRPADITSSVLRKVASEADFFVGSADAAEAEGLNELVEKKGLSKSATVKQAAISKLADIIKEIDDGQVTDVSSSALEILNKTRDPSLSIIPKLYALGDFNQIMNGMAELGISPSVSFLAELISHGRPEHKEGIGHQVEAMLPTVSLAEIPASAIDMVPEVYEDTPNPFLMKVLEELQLGSSLTPYAVEKRAYYWEQVVPQQDPRRAHGAQGHQITIPGEITATDYLLALAGGALFGKFLLAALAKQKNQLKLVYGNEQVKRASHFSVIQRLLDDSALSELLKLKN